MDAAAGHQVQEHYASEGIAARILAALRAAGCGKAGPITPGMLAPLDHFHGRGLKATQETEPVCPRTASNSVPFSASQTFTHWSKLPLAICLPSGLHATLFTPQECA